jgi:hypothetical protein
MDVVNTEQVVAPVSDWNLTLTHILPQARIAEEVHGRLRRYGPRTRPGPTSAVTAESLACPIHR